MEDTSSILILDDEPGIRRMFRRYLEKAGHTVLESGNADEGFSELKNNKIDLVLLDMIMPGMNGIDALKLINRDHPGIPVIMITAVSKLDTAVNSMKEGALDYIVKPVHRKQLIDVVQKGLEQKRLIKENMQTPFIADLVLILDEGGLVLFKMNINKDLDFDEDIFGGMFTAVKMFIKDSLDSKGNLKNIQHGDHNIIIEEGNDFFLAVIGHGDETKKVRNKLKKITDWIYENWNEMRSICQDNTDTNIDLQAMLKNLNA